MDPWQIRLTVRGESPDGAPQGLELSLDDDLVALAQGRQGVILAARLGP